MEMIVKPISYMKANAAALKDTLGHEPMHVTQNGEATLVVQTAARYKYTQEKIAAMQLVLQSQREIAAGRYTVLEDFINEL